MTNRRGTSSCPYCETAAVTGFPCPIHTVPPPAIEHPPVELPPIPGEGDPERETKLDAERVTLEFRTASRRRLDAGSKPITDSPLFGGPAQGEMF